MLPGTLAPLDPRKTRALTSIYAPRKLKTRTNTAETRMLDNDIQIKPALSPFHPLPAIGQKLERSKTKVIVFDFNKDTGPMNRSIKIHDVLKPLTPLRIQGYKRKSSLDKIEIKKPQQLIRENTYDVLDPVYVTAASANEANKTRQLSEQQDTIKKVTPKNVADERVSPKTRFKKAALQVAKLSMPETGKLLCLRERQTYNFCRPGEEETQCKLENLPQSPVQKLDKLSEIFQSLETNGRNRDRMKKENSWF